MDSLIDFALKREYERLQKLGDRLNDVNKLIDWNLFKPIVSELFDNKSEKGGRPNIDEIVMVKMLLLQAWYGLSDQELERQVADRISFRKFLGFPSDVPDYTTVWYFRERLAKMGKDKDIWSELQRQLESKGLSIKKGVIQDATFISSDPGQNASKPRGEGAKTRRSKDGNWAKRNRKNEFGFKLHSLMDLEDGLIRRFEVTSANVHDNNIDLSQKGEVVYRDKGYFGTTPKGYDGTMKRAVRGRKLSRAENHRNKRIMRKRKKVERHYAVIKRVFKSGHMLVTTLPRVQVKMMFVCFSFNLYQLQTLSKTMA
ncbi:MAG: Transposase DDE domain protein [Candidatus Methanofastidiosum methylothiophilum]|uniref:Transposase DDE domain protein n=1 Tax=Candidatus Methanofastidiosum methylothiophilum TaxID=1705564 RepID=A0A150IHR4_9EURY|nr:MAG: Transposase DDE domain protein [Candidatus Methanofastidiosum methylthiophilus]KYC47798.1 MAG: Transposase DDE domain protein [Candidatus Methanofastidiosum methylthiophilus]KYC51082.1 MAG: Transposase DDE domain protein [Candidatus Methanofastidiosum methylthiophilus]